MSGMGSDIAAWGVQSGVCAPVRDEEKENFMMATGNIKQLVRNRGFGFITADDGREIFFHHSGVEGTPFESLRQGQRVSFDVEQGQKGPRAVHVQLADPVPSR